MTPTELNDMQPKARRGRPRSFDRDKALGQAMQIFQANGYEGTSMTQLVEAMGIVSPSIYSAFGSKEDLFREAVGLYRSRVVEPIWDELDQTADVKQAVHKLLFTSIDIFAKSGQQNGCLIMLGTGHLGGADESVRSFLLQQRKNFKSRLERRFERGVTEGSLPSNVEPETLTDCVLAFFGGLAIQSVDGVESAALRRSAQLFCERLLG